MTLLRSLIAWGMPMLPSVPALAASYTLWINGRGGGAVGNYDNFGYWGPAQAQPPSECGPSAAAR